MITKEQAIRATEELQRYADTTTQASYADQVRLYLTQSDGLVNETPKPSTRKEILEEAIRCVTKDRNATHGEPEDNFAVIADFWTTYLMGCKKANNFIDSKDVAAMMMLMKIARIISSPSCIDHWLDSAGYAACGGEIACIQKPLTGNRM